MISVSLSLVHQDVLTGRDYQDVVTGLVRRTSAVTSSLPLIPLPPLFVLLLRAAVATAIFQTSAVVYSTSPHNGTGYPSFFAEETLKLPSLVKITYDMVSFIHPTTLRDRKLAILSNSKCCHVIWSSEVE